MPMTESDCSYPVVTTRLWGKLAPLERLIYTSTPLTAFLIRALYPEVGDDTIDSWDLQDFVSHGLEAASRYDWVTPGAVLRWSRQEVWRRKKRQARYDVQPGSALVDDEEIKSDTLPPEVIDWLDEQLRPTLVQALCWVSERGYTIREAAELLDIPVASVYAGLYKLRQRMEEDVHTD